MGMKEVYNCYFYLRFIFCYIFSSFFTSTTVENKYRKKRDSKKKREIGWATLSVFAKKGASHHVLV